MYHMYNTPLYQHSKGKIIRVGVENTPPPNSPPIYIRQKKKTIGIGLKLILQQKSVIEKEHLCLYGQSHSLPG